MFARYSSAIFLLVCALTAAVPIASAQTISSAILTGTVRDPSDAVVPAAVVEVVNRATNQRWQTTTDARGRFTLLYLPVGDYRLTVPVPGFTAPSVDLTLAVGERLDLPVARCCAWSGHMPDAPGRQQCATVAAGACPQHAASGVASSDSVCSSETATATAARRERNVRIAPVVLRIGSEPRQAYST